LFPSRCLLVLIALPLLGIRAEAQGLSATATIGVRLHVLPVASFEGGPTHRIATVLEPGEPKRIAPADGARTRMRYNAPTRVTVTGTALRGADGTVVPLRLLCASGAPGAPVADQPFDCDEGFTAPLPLGRAMALPLAVGGAVAAADSRAIPGGLYVAQVTFMASAPAY
jgi:hypothetical protein